MSLLKLLVNCACLASIILKFLCDIYGHDV